MVKPKKSSNKPKRGVDFKKIKRKIGRKLPPPKNATNTEIKSKAIVLREQSVAVERQGMVVDKRGLTLPELIKKTSHRNPKMRKDALNGIKEIILKDPSKLKTHVVFMMEKLNQLIRDIDGAVRDTFFNLLKTVIFPSLKGEIPGAMIPLLVDHSLHAMTHLSVDIRIMAFKFLQLVIDNHPITFFHYAKRVLDNYTYILNDRQICLQDKSKLKTALGGLVQCLSLLASETVELRNKAPDRRISTFFRFEDQQGFYPVVKKLEDLVPVLINCFRESSSFHVTTDSDGQSFEYMLLTIQCINQASRILGYVIKKHQHHDSQTYCRQCYKPDLLWSHILLHLRKLQRTVPFGRNHISHENEEARFFVLNIRVAEMFLHLKDMMNDASFISEQFLEFIEFSLLRKVGASGSDVALHKSFVERHIASLLPFIPGLVSQTTRSYQARLLEAFTDAFRDCKVNSTQILGYFSALEEMILPDKVDNLGLATNCPYLMDHQIAWVKEFPRILSELDDKHPSISEVALKLLNRFVQFAPPNTPLMSEVENLQLTLKEFYDVRTIAGTIHRGAFIKLPYDCQFLALCIISNLPKMDTEFIYALARCCVCSDLDPKILHIIISDLQASYKMGRVQIADHLSLLLTIIARFHVYPENILFKKKELNVSNFLQYKEVLRKISLLLMREMSHIGGPVILRELWDVIIDELSRKPPLENAWALLIMIISLDRHTTRISDENIHMLGKQISGYMVDAAFCMPEDVDMTAQSDEIRTLGNIIRPCFLLLRGSHKLFHFVFEFLDSMVMEWSSSCPSQFDSKYKHEPSARVRVINFIFICMCQHNDAKLRHNLQLCKLDIRNILHSIQQLLDPDRSGVTVLEKHKIQKAFDQLKNTIREIQCCDASELEGV